MKTNPSADQLLVGYDRKHTIYAEYLIINPRINPIIIIINQ